MKRPPLHSFAKSVRCETRIDNLTRQLYATDASVYQVEPKAVAFPKSPQETAEVMQAAAAAGLPITPRGAGSGLAGAALGDGIVLDFSRHARAITGFNRDARTVRVEAGVVLDQLNAFLEPHGLTFGPDVATSSRATLGGMIANNSSGARAPIYGVTTDHVRALEVVLADGRIEEVGAAKNGLPEIAEAVEAIVRPHTEAIQTLFHEGVCKRWPGFGLDRYLRADYDLAKVLGGSEGTLAAVYSAELNLVPLPKDKGLAVIFFTNVEEAMQATVELMDMAPAGIEHIDDILLDQTKNQLQFKAARGLLELDDKPCKSMLLVEFYEDEGDKLAALAQRKLGLRTYVCKSRAEMATVWNVRKAGLSLLTGRKGAAKPVAGVEDVAVSTTQLPEYVSGLRSLMESQGLEASYYGHAASGLLHIRPIVNMRRAEDIAKFRNVAEGVSTLARQFKGSYAAEHGVGIARTEFVEAQIGNDLLEAMRRIKAVFDPKQMMNPGKIFDDGSYRIDTHLRQGAGTAIEPPFEDVLAYAAKDGSFVANLEQCNGCGGCRKSGPTMCPTFIATGDEVMSTRGRANVIRAVLEGRLENDTPGIWNEDLEHAIGNCLSCKSCATECPSNVNMALLKAELLHARHKARGIPLGTRIMSRVDLLGPMGTATPALANAALRWPWMRAIMQRSLGIAARRPLPEYTNEPFTPWFHKRTPKGNATRGRVLLWDDCFVRYNEPQIGRAAVRVLEAAGFEVALPAGRKCCGRPAFSMGRLDLARRFGQHNVALLEKEDAPVVFLEASCFTMFKQDYEELRIPGAKALSERIFLFEHFIEDLLAQDPGALPFNAKPAKTAIHAHCHAKSAGETDAMPALAKRIPGNDVALLDTGCCGMAGAFGALETKYDLSLEVAQDLVKKIEALDAGTQLVASGTSCRHQIKHLTRTEPLHMAELLERALEK